MQLDERRGLAAQTWGKDIASDAGRLDGAPGSRMGSLHGEHGADFRKAVKVILFGATGMVGQGVLRECLRDDGVESVLVIGRTSTGVTHPKLRELIRKDL